MWWANNKKEKPLANTTKLFLLLPSAKGRMEFVSMEQWSVLCIFMVLMVNWSSRIVPA